MRSENANYPSLQADLVSSIYLENALPPQNAFYHLENSCLARNVLPGLDRESILIAPFVSRLGSDFFKIRVHLELMKVSQNEG